MPFWLIPDILLKKVQAHPQLQQYFNDISHACYSSMMVKVISYIVDHSEIPHCIITCMQKTHSKYNIHIDHVTAFIDLFMEAVEEIGATNEFDLRSIRSYLNALSKQIIITEDTMKTQVLAKLDEVINDIECYKDYKDIKLLLEEAKTKVISSKRRSLEVNQQYDAA